MAPSDSADRLPSRPALRDNRCLHLRRPIPAPASAGEHLKPLSTLTHRIVTRDYHRSSASIIAEARKVDAVSDQRKVGSAPRLLTSGRVAQHMIDKSRCQIGGAPGVDIKPLVSLLLLPRRQGDFIATCSNFQSASQACPSWGSSGSRAIERPCQPDPRSGRRETRFDRPNSAHFPIVTCQIASN